MNDIARAQIVYMDENFETLLVYIRVVSCFCRRTNELRSTVQKKIRKQIWTGVENRSFHLVNSIFLNTILSSKAFGIIYNTNQKQKNVHMVQDLRNQETHVRLYLSGRHASPFFLHTQSRQLTTKRKRKQSVLWRSRSAPPDVKLEPKCKQV